MKTRIVAVTPAGRRHYLEVLKGYILRDDSIDEWQLWDNCRTIDDRLYIERLAQQHPKISLVRGKGSDGTNRSVNQFYHLLSDPHTFYIKLDDDIVYLPSDFGRELHERAARDKQKYLYWSPLVINNALCSWILKYHSKITVGSPLTASAGCTIGWRSPYFAIALHRAFCDALESGLTGRFKTGNFDVSLARFSINCIGFFGDEVARLGAEFCPLGVDDEEWLSAVLPSKLGKPGRIVGDVLIAHFSFFTQEDELLRSDILERYYRVAGLDSKPVKPASRKKSLMQRIRRRLELRWFGGGKSHHVAP
jgi:hypothetical protein